MGTSNWQQIPFCIDALMKIAPSRVLDVGVGFGRWGMVVREFCDVWYSRVFQDQWTVHVEGIEAFPRSISEYHRSFYNKIHLGDAAEILPTLEGPWSVTIYGDVLEHFTKAKASELLRLSLDRSDYVIVNIPLGEEHPQSEAYGNAYEAHLSAWEPDDFRPFGLVRHALLKDYLGRDYGSFVLSRKDPKDLRQSLFSRGAQYGEPPASGDSTLDTVLARVAEQSYELNFIKNSGTYRLANRLRSSPMARAVRGLRETGRDRLTIRALGTSGEYSQGREVWVLGVSGTPGEIAVPWDFIERRGEWKVESSAACAYGKCLVGEEGALSLRAGADPEVRFMTHAWSGHVEIELNGRRETIDLYSSESAMIRVRPARSPMLVAAAVASVEIAGLPEAPELPPRPVNGAATRRKPGRRLTDHQQKFIDRVRAAAPRAVAVHCPRWLGVTGSTQTLFEHCYAIPATASEDPQDIADDVMEAHARTLLDTGVRHVVFSGGDEAHFRLMNILKDLDPALRCSLLWHGNYIQWSDDYVWRIFQLWADAAKTGRVSTIGTVKKGMEEFLNASGLPSRLVLNYVPGTPMAPPEIDSTSPQIGLWMSGTFWKSPNAMLAAVKFMPDACVHTAGLDARTRELVSYFGINARTCFEGTIPRERLLEEMRRTHVTLYVTFSECCPMTPLESMSVGVPCLIGPASHLFDDNAFLYERLVVPFPDRAEVIAKQLRRLFEERREVMAEYTRYLPGYIETAKRSVDAFLD